jgi:hypothetical protein
MYRRAVEDSWIVYGGRSEQAQRSRFALIDRNVALDWLSANRIDWHVVATGDCMAGLIRDV